MEFLFFGTIIDSNNLPTLGNLRVELNPNRVYEIIAKPVFRNIGTDFSYTIETFLYDQNNANILARGEVIWPENDDVYLRSFAADDAILKTPL